MSALPKADLEALAEEHRALVNRRFGTELSPQEERRFRMVRWYLDRAREEMTVPQEQHALVKVAEAYSRAAASMEEIIELLRVNVPSGEETP